MSQRHTQKLHPSPGASLTINNKQRRDDAFLSQKTHLSPYGSQNVFNGEGVLCLNDYNPLKRIPHVCCQKSSKSGDINVSLISNEKSKEEDFLSTASVTQTNVMNYANEDYFRSAQSRGPRASAKTPGHIFGTQPFNDKLHQSIRSCHSRSSSEDHKCRQSASHQANSFTNTEKTPKAKLSHTDTQGRATMVDVSGKVPTCRTAKAQATVFLGPTAFLLLRENQLVKGDALAVAQVAGILASKQTSTLIPLCHPLPLDHVSVTFKLDEVKNAAIVTATCRTTGRTGVEMEALTAVSVAALTIYDMCKAVSHNIIITDITLIAKTGGKRDFNSHLNAVNDNLPNLGN